MHIYIKINFIKYSTKYVYIYSEKVRQTDKALELPEEGAREACSSSRSRTAPPRVHVIARMVCRLTMQL